MLRLRLLEGMQVCIRFVGLIRPCHNRPGPVICVMWADPAPLPKGRTTFPTSLRGLKIGRTYSGPNIRTAWSLVIVVGGKPILGGAGVLSYQSSAMCPSCFSSQMSARDPVADPAMPVADGDIPPDAEAGCGSKRLRGSGRPTPDEYRPGATAGLVGTRRVPTSHVVHTRTRSSVVLGENNRPLWRRTHIFGSYPPLPPEPACRLKI